MKSTKFLALSGVLGIAGLAAADITSYSSSTSFYEYQYVSDPSGFYTYPYSYANGGTFGGYSATGGWTSTTQAGEVDNIYTDGAFSTSLMTSTPTHLETSAAFYSYAEVMRVASGLNNALGVVVGEQYLNFNLDSAATVTLTANNIYNNAVLAGNYSIVNLDGIYYSFGVTSFTQTINVGAGSHQVWIHGETDTQVSPGGGTLSFSDQLTGYHVDINAVPEPCSLLAMGGRPFWPFDDAVRLLKAAPCNETISGVICLRDRFSLWLGTSTLRKISWTKGTLVDCFERLTRSMH